MYRTLPYLGLFAAAALLQVFLFDNLTISIYLNPLVYIVFIALLPLDTLPVAVLGAGLALGVTMDCVMGAAGINTIATLLIAFLRPTLIGMLYGSENAREGGIPSSARFGERLFVGYLVALTLIHMPSSFRSRPSRGPMCCIRCCASLSARRCRWASSGSSPVSSRPNSPCAYESFGGFCPDADPAGRRAAGLCADRRGGWPTSS